MGECECCGAALGDYVPYTARGRPPNMFRLCVHARRDGVRIPHEEAQERGFGRGSFRSAPKPATSSRSRRRRKRSKHSAAVDILPPSMGNNSRSHPRTAALTVSWARLAILRSSEVSCGGREQPSSPRSGAGAHAECQRRRASSPVVWNLWAGQHDDVLVTWRWAVLNR